MFLLATAHSVRLLEGQICTDSAGVEIFCATLAAAMSPFTQHPLSERVDPGRMRSAEVAECVGPS